VDFIRTPCNEWLLFENAEYLGIAKIKNGKYGYDYEAHLWLVDFLSVSGFDFDEPERGILQIKRWRNNGLEDPRIALQCQCAIIADFDRQILAIETNMSSFQEKP